MLAEKLTAVVAIKLWDAGFAGEQSADAEAEQQNGFPVFVSEDIFEVLRTALAAYQDSGEP